MKNTITKKMFHKKPDFISKFYKITNSILNLLTLFVMCEAAYFVFKLIGFLSVNKSI